jgi:hypothetical protein
MQLVSAELPKRGTIPFSTGSAAIKGVADGDVYRVSASFDAQAVNGVWRYVFTYSRGLPASRCPAPKPQLIYSGANGARVTSAFLGSLASSFGMTTTSNVDPAPAGLPMDVSFDAPPFGFEGILVRTNFKVQSEDVDVDVPKAPHDVTLEDSRVVDKLSANDHSVLMIMAVWHEIVETARRSCAFRAGRFSVAGSRRVWIPPSKPV